MGNARRILDAQERFVPERVADDVVASAEPAPVICLALPLFFKLANAIYLLSEDEPSEESSLLSLTWLYLVPDLGVSDGGRWYGAASGTEEVRVPIGPSG